MRRQEKYICNGALIGVGLFTFGDIIIQWIEHNNRGEKFTWKSYDGWRTFKNGCIGGTLGAGISYAVYYYKISEEEKLPFCSDEYLKKILTKEHIKSEPSLYDKIITNRQILKEWLIKKFGNKLITSPEDTGSFYKKTAILSNFDLDIILPFKKESYNTLEEMYYDVYNVIGNEFEGKATVTKSTKAIGLTFDYDGNCIHYDIVPGREINNYSEEKDLNLYVKPEWVWQKGSSFKTNVKIQKRITVNNPKARNVIKLLKVYRDRNDLQLPSLLIEQSVVNALSENNFGVYASDSENLINSMIYISNKMEQKNLIDIANSNNNLNDKLDHLQKQYVSLLLKKDVGLIGDNPRYIKEIFEC